MSDQVLFTVSFRPLIIISLHIHRSSTGLGPNMAQNKPSPRPTPKNTLDVSPILGDPPPCHQQMGEKIRTVIKKTPANQTAATPNRWKKPSTPGTPAIHTDQRHLIRLQTTNTIPIWMNKWLDTGSKQQNDGLGNTITQHNPPIKAVIGSGHPDNSRSEPHSRHLPSHTTILETKAQKVGLDRLDERKSTD